MPSIFFDAKQQYVPGAYTKTEVRSSLPGPLPALHVAVLLGQGPVGVPYHAADTALDVEGNLTPYTYCGTATKIARENGYQSELHLAAKYAWRHGLPGAYVINLAPLTRAALELLDGLGTAQLTVYPRSYGAPANAISVAYDATADTLTVVPVKAFAMLKSTIADGATRVYLDGAHDWVKAGTVLMLADNVEAAVEVTVADAGTEVDSNGQLRYWFAPTAAITTGVATTQYALVYQLDTANTLVGTGLTTPQEVLDFINTNASMRELLVAEKHANYDGTNLATVAAASIGWSTNSSAAGTSPSMSNTELTDFVSRMNASEWEKWTEAEQVIPHSYLLVSHVSNMHATMRDYAIAERGRGYPIALTVGCNWGDVIVGAGDTTDPVYRAGLLDSQDVCLVANGMSRLGSFLTRAPAVWARRVAGGPGHNLTNDSFVADEPEVLWDEIDSGELTSLLKAGVVSIKLSVGQSIRYTLSQGLNTLQANGGAIWNEVDATTWSLMQRDLADFANLVIRRDMESLQVGANKVDPTTIGAVLERRAARSLLRQGYIVDFNIVSITLNDSGSGYDVVWQVKLPTTADFITITTVILLGD